jgi:hypothetical protein
MHWSSDESLWRQVEVEQETSSVDLAMETAEGEEAMMLFVRYLIQSSDTGR